MKKVITLITFALVYFASSTVFAEGTVLQPLKKSGFFSGGSSKIKDKVNDFKDKVKDKAGSHKSKWDGWKKSHDKKSSGSGWHKVNKPSKKSKDNDKKRVRVFRCGYLDESTSFFKRRYFIASEKNKASALSRSKRRCELREGYPFGIEVCEKITCYRTTEWE